MLSRLTRPALSFICGSTDGNAAPPLPDADTSAGFLARFSPVLNTLVTQVTIPAVTYEIPSFPVLAIDGRGNVIVGGDSRAGDFSATSGLVPIDWLNIYGVVVMEFSPDLQTLIWGSFFGDSVAGAAVDGRGDVWITGTARGYSFPAATLYQQGQDVQQFAEFAYVAELSPDGSQVQAEPRDQKRRRREIWTMRGSPAALILPNVEVLATLAPGALK